MPKGKTKLKDMTNEILDRLDSLEEMAGRSTTNFENEMTAVNNKILALEDAICPQVAARLTRLERAVDNLTTAKGTSGVSFVPTGTDRYRQISDIIWQRLGICLTTANVRIIGSIIERIK